MTTILRPCGLDGCDVVDDGPRNQIDLGDGRSVFCHLPGSPECGVAGADPFPDIDEDAGSSQFRAALIAIGADPAALPDRMVVPSVDCSDPANHYAPVED